MYFHQIKFAKILLFNYYWQESITIPPAFIIDAIIRPHMEMGASWWLYPHFPSFMAASILLHHQYHDLVNNGISHFFVNHLVIFKTDHGEHPLCMYAYMLSYLNNNREKCVTVDRCVNIIHAANVTCSTYKWMS